MKLFIVLIFLLITSSLQAEGGFDKYIQCRRDSELRLILPKFKDKDLCIGSVIIQGISYECGKLCWERILPTQLTWSI